MKSPLKRSAFVAVLLAPVLTACGFGAQTDQVYQPAQGVNDRSGAVEILNALVVAGEDGAGTFAGTFVNTTGDEESLTSVTGDGVTAASDGVKVGSRALANLADPARNGKAQLTLTGDGVKIGRFVRLTFTFSGGSSTTVNVPIVSTDSRIGSEFKDVPLPAADATQAG